MVSAYAVRLPLTPLLYPGSAHLCNDMPPHAEVSRPGRRASLARLRVAIETSL